MTAKDGMMAEQTLADLHARLLSGDLRAASRIVEHALERMVRSVAAAVPKLHDRHDVEEACQDALLGYLADPTRYDPTRSNLLTYLIRRARSVAMTVARAERRRSWIEDDYALARTVTFGDGGDGGAFEVALLHELVTSHWAAICPTALDEEVFLLVAAGERRCVAYLEALGLPDTIDNRNAVERHRERVRGRIRRLQPALQC